MVISLAARTTLPCIINHVASYGTQWHNRSNVPRIVSINTVLSLIDEKLPYIDRVKLWLNAEPDFSIDTLESYCGSLRARPNRMPINRSPIDWCYFIDMSQPRRGAFTYLQRNIRRPTLYHFTYAELSLDFTTSSLANLLTIRSFFDRHWVQPHHRSGYVTMADEESRYYDEDDLVNLYTTYYGRRTATVKHLMYSDRPSKVNQGMCCHLEVRMQNSRTLQRAGLNHFSAFLEPELHRNFWTKRLQLRAMRNFEEIKSETMIILRDSMRQSSDQNFRKTYNLLMRLFKADGLERSQHLVDHGKLVNAKKRFTALIDNQPFLPA